MFTSEHVEFFFYVSLTPCHPTMWTGLVTLSGWCQRNQNWILWMQRHRCPRVESNAEQSFGDGSPPRVNFFDSVTTMHWNELPAPYTLGYNSRWKPIFYLRIGFEFFLYFTLHCAAPARVCWSPQNTGDQRMTDGRHWSRSAQFTIY